MVKPISTFYSNDVFAFKIICLNKKQKSYQSSIRY